MANIRRAALCVCLPCVVALLPGCVRVAPYERQRLAHPTMKPGFGETPAEAHMNAVQEGARGGAVSTASGCGCN